MSLNWDLRSIQGSDDLCWIEKNDGERTMNPVTEVMIYATMSTGIGEITEKNWIEFYKRIHAWERLVGPWLNSSGDTERYITATEVKSHIGLSTNASYKDETRSKIIKNIWECMKADV